MCIERLVVLWGMCLLLLAQLETCVNAVVTV